MQIRGTWTTIDDSNGDVIDPPENLGGSDLGSEQVAPNRLSVTQNLETALRYLRTTDASRILWIDAICIDQGNIEERSAEVLRMGDIYKWAQRVIICLGAGTYVTHSAMKFMMYIAGHVEFDFIIRLLTYLGDSKEEITKRFNNWFTSPDSSEQREGVKDLLSRPWFRRLWIWQELCQAREAVVICGHDEINWQAFSKAVVCIDYQIRNTIVRDPSQKDSVAPFKELTLQTLLLIYGAADMGRNGHGDFLDLLDTTRQARCEDPRDRVYAQMSMLPKHLRAVLKPDYTKSTCQVYTEAALAILAREKYGLRILFHCSERSPDDCLPSWVPDWAVPRRTHRGEFISGFQASGPSGSETSFKSGVGLLVQGVSTSTVVEVSGQVKPGPRFEDVVSVWSSWARPESYEQSYYAGGTLFDAYCSTLVCGNLKERFKNSHSSRQRNFPSPKMVRIMLRDLREQDPERSRYWRQERYAEERAQNDDKDKLFIARQFQDCERRTINDTGGRRFFTTVQGHVGLGPAELQAGDDICVFLGLDCPVALRPAGNDQFRVIGCCYVPGLMDGEALLGPLPKSQVVRYKTIKLAEGKTGGIGIFFVDMKSKLKTQEDPRLWELPPRWTSYYDETGQLIFKKAGGGSTWRDPRLTSEELEKHGVKMQTFRLV
jgi:hypothetical protein